MVWKADLDSINAHCDGEEEDVEASTEASHREPLLGEGSWGEEVGGEEWGGGEVIKGELTYKPK